MALALVAMIVHIRLLYKSLTCRGGGSAWGWEQQLDVESESGSDNYR